MLILPSKDFLREMLYQQFKIGIGDVFAYESMVEQFWEESIVRMKMCLQVSAIKQARQGNEVCFNCLHHGQYAVFLLFLGNAIYRSEKKGGYINHIYLI